MRSRAWLSARAIVVGLLSSFALTWIVAVPLTFGAQWLVSHRLLPRRPLLSVLPTALSLVVAVCAGWVVARVHRREPVWAVGSYLVVVVVAASPRFIALIVDAVGHPRYIVPLFMYLLNVLVMVGATIAGGLLAAGRAQTAGSLLAPDAEEDRAG